MQSPNRKVVEDGGLRFVIPKIAIVYFGSDMVSFAQS